MEVDLEGNDDFDAGFASNVEAPTTTPTAKTETQAEPVVEPAAPAPVEPVAPEYVQVTKADYEKLMGAATAIDEIKADHKKQIDGMNGKFGGMKEIVDRLQAATPKGEAVQVTNAQLENLRKDFPDLADILEKDLNSVLSKHVGTGAQSFDQTALDALFQEKMTPALQAVKQETTQEITQAFEKKALTRLHPDWTQVVADKGFRTWLAAQPDDYRQKAENDWDADFIGTVLTTFKQSKTTAPNPANSQKTARQNRFEQAVNPRGTGGHAPAPEEEDEFAAGFNGR